MGFLDRLLGRQPEPRDDVRRQPMSRRPTGVGGTSSSEELTDEQALERYRYLLRTAPPEQIEQAHAEAFGQLTPEQRRLVLEGLSADLPAGERSDRDDPRSLARMATRAEMRRPGTMERTFGGMNPGGMGMGMGGLMAGSFLSTIAGVVIGSAVADAIFNDGDGGSDQGDGGSEGDQGADSGDTGDTGSDGGDTGFDAGGDAGGGDFGGGDFGGGFGGGDFGGGDFGGGGDF